MLALGILSKKADAKRRKIRVEIPLFGQDTEPYFTLPDSRFIYGAEPPAVRLVNAPAPK
jgi:hypothetical protein